MELTANSKALQYVGGHGNLPFYELLCCYRRTGLPMHTLPRLLVELFDVEYVPPGFESHTYN